MATRLKDDLVVNKYNDNEDLLIFGYSCKLFRDDEKALYIDQGKHLIPWMGDETLKIDRYDARGTLFDLKEVEAPNGGFDRFFGLTDMEKHVETMCDEERYRALTTNEEEETMYQEEELKRLHYAIGDKGNSYGQVEYKYDGEPSLPEENTEVVQNDKSEEGEDEPFVPSPQLDLPVNMILPETVKLNAIIEKTALFISNQGPQMEILLKMKQAGNPQFNFLSFDSPLHSYYRHLLMAIKSGRYNPEIEGSKKTEVESSEDEHYLHPSLASSVSKVELAPSIPSINYKPSAHCAYSMLVNKIKDKKANEQVMKTNDAAEDTKKNNATEKTSEGERLHPSNSQTFPTPSKELQNIIDKTASYVAKNGRDFETVVQMKNDPRFDFLNPSHTYNPYYRFKIKQYENIEKGLKPEGKSKEEQSKSKLAPVCFSIKKPKETEPVIEKSALPVEESSDEEGKERSVSEEREKEKNGREDVVTIDLAAIEEKEEKNKKILAAERLKDKLSAAAREKVALACKEKQLQLERKRRAAAFLKTIHPDGKVVYGPQLPDGEGGSDVASLPDSPEEEENRTERGKRSEETKRGHGRVSSSGEVREKRHRESESHHRRKHREKFKSKSEKTEKTTDGERARELYERAAESSASSEEDSRRRGHHGEKCRRSGESKKYKSVEGRTEEKRHKKKKHRREASVDKSSRKHGKLKRERRSRKDEEKTKTKRSKRNSSKSSSSSSSREFNS